MIESSGHATRPSVDETVEARTLSDMRAVVCHQFGPPERLVVEEVDDPRPSAGQLLVTVAASAVTFPDTLMLEDKYQFKATPPYIPGGEVTGVVAAIGDGVEGWTVGDRVVGGLGTIGGYAELAAVPALSRRRVPSRSTSPSSPV